MCSFDARGGSHSTYEQFGSWVGSKRGRCSLGPVGLTFYHPLVIFTIKLLQSRLILSRSSFLCR